MCKENLLNLVKEAFSFIISFHEASENFYNHCLTESARRDRELDTQRVSDYVTYMQRVQTNDFA